MSVRNPQTNAVESATELGKALGLDVQPVGNVQQAFTLFTDGEYRYPSAPAFTLPAAVQDLADSQTDDLLARLAAEIGQLPSDPQVKPIKDLLATAQAARDGGQVAVAYGVGMQGLNMAGRERASQEAQTQLASNGVAGGKAWLVAWLRRASSRNSSALARGAGLAAAMGYEQQVTLPNALSWLAYNQAILASVTQQIEGANLDAAGVDRLARVLADVDTAIDVYFPNQLAIIQASPARPSPGEAIVASYLAEYTAFLVRAGQAQQSYAQQVLMNGQDPAAVAKQNDVGLLLPVVLDLAEAVTASPDGEDSISQAVLHATTAITYYIAATSLIASVQDFGIDQFGIGADPMNVRQAEVLSASVLTAKQAVDEVSALLGQRGLDASLPTWASAYGVGAAEALSQGPEATAAKVLALNELYFDAITVFMLQSGPVP